MEVDGERNTKYFHSLEKRNATINNIHKLKIDQQISEDPPKISNAVEKLYKNLYSAPNDSYSPYYLFSSIYNEAQRIDQTQKKYLIKIYPWKN